MSDFDTKMTEIDLKLQIHALKQENAALREDKEQLKRESAALWESKERLFYLSEHWNPKNDFKNDEIGKRIVIGDYERMIAAIDAARKEAQP